MSKWYSLFDCSPDSRGWATLDTQSLLQRTEQTVSVNAGAFAVPLASVGGSMLRRTMPLGAEDGYEVPEEYKGIYDLHYDDYDDYGG